MSRSFVKETSGGGDFIYGVGKGLPIRVSNGNNLIIELGDIYFTQDRGQKHQSNFYPFPS